MGLPDDIAGEVPVAVVQSLMSSTKTDIMRLVAHLGPSHALASVITLEELGINQYPLTAAGKVRKNVLKELIACHFHVKLDNPIETPEAYDTPLTPPLTPFGNCKESQGVETSVSTDSPEMAETIQKLTDIWTTLVVNPPGRNDSVYDVADSISLLRYINKVWRDLGKKLYLQDFMEHDTIELQAKLLLSRDECSEEPATSSMLTIP